ncbi:MAG: SRPBCC domain-containing protein [Gemmatimonadaceae bacterium]|nr:SRPBCC domain-containing protein [Gemmatimonadaceae bacterium]
MADILHDLPIAAPVAAVFAAVSSPAGLDAWWTLGASGEARVGADYELFFGEEYDWRARVTRCTNDGSFALSMTHASADWLGTTVSFVLEPRGDVTWLHFAHTGWRQASDHYRVSSFCWAMYLRLLKRWVETGDAVPYEKRLDA